MWLSNILTLSVRGFREKASFNYASLCSSLRITTNTEIDPVHGEMH
jgi:hypothetical protein